MLFRQLQPSVFKMAGSAPEDCVYIDLSGASSGIGEATAIKLAEHGATLFLVALEENKLQIVQQKCKEKGLVEEKVSYLNLDMNIILSLIYQDHHNNFIKCKLNLILKYLDCRMNELPFNVQWQMLHAYYDEKMSM